jgi:DNA polymerase V
MPSYIAHLDADCFYVSAERVRHPGLIGKPVGVLGNNGACVIAKSYEMKASGVKTGTAIWDAANHASPSHPGIITKPAQIHHLLCLRR